MCLPCFQWAWARYEDPLDANSGLPEHAAWVPTGNNCWALQRTVGDCLPLKEKILMFDPLPRPYLCGVMPIPSSDGLAPANRM
ncbi:hypothetical protein V2G26_020825 [Clonostachys chloroleuca]